GVQQVADAPQDLLALAGLHGGPRAVVEGAAGGGHGPVHVGGAAVGDPGALGARGGVGGGEGASVRGADPLAVDEQLVRAGEELAGLGAEPLVDAIGAVRGEGAGHDYLRCTLTGSV